MGISLSPWCFQLFAFSLRFSSSSNRSLILRTVLPSIPAVFLPALSWVTWRIAKSLADFERIISFCKDRALRISPARTAFQTRFCNRNKFLRNFFHGSFLQDSLLSFLMCLIMIYSRLFVLSSSDQLRSVLPLAWVSDARLSYLGFRPFPKPSRGFYSFRRLDCFDDLGWFTSPARLLGEAAIKLKMLREYRRLNRTLQNVLVWSLYVLYSDCGFSVWRFYRYLFYPYHLPISISVPNLLWLWLCPVPSFSLPNSESGHCGQIGSQFSLKRWDLNLFKFGYPYCLWTYIHPR